jgi:hypothetical protein
MDMSKNQRRGNRETKKPKKEKSPAVSATSGTPWLSIEKLKDQGRTKK